MRPSLCMGLRLGAALMLAAVFLLACGAADDGLPASDPPASDQPAMRPPSVKPETDGASPEPSSDQTPAEFAEPGTLQRDDPEEPPFAWVLRLAERDGSSAIAELEFTAESGCVSEAGNAMLCKGLTPGDRVLVEGIREGDRVRVERLQVLSAAVVRQQIPVDVYFFDEEAVETGEEPLLIPVRRGATPPAVGGGALDALFAGPTGPEWQRGLRFVASGASGAVITVLADGIAHVHLIGGCDSQGSVYTVADHIISTLKQFPTVHYVKIYGPDGRTSQPRGPGDSLPECLQP